MTVTIAVLLVALAVAGCGSSGPSTVVRTVTVDASTTPGATETVPKPGKVAIAAAKAAAEASSKGSATGAHGSPDGLYKRFFACMREHGVAYPKAKLLHGKTVLGSSSVSTSTPQFKVAHAACARLTLAAG